MYKLYRDFILIASTLANGMNLIRLALLFLFDFFYKKTNKPLVCIVNPSKYIHD